MKTKKSSTLIVIFFTVFLNSLGISIIIPVLAMLFLAPSNQVLGRDMSISQIMIIIGLLKASYPLLQFIGAPILGSISDRVGRRPVLLFSLQGTIVGYCLIIYGIIYQSIPLIFAGRIIDGITGGNVSVVYSAIADVTESKDKPRRFGMVGMAFGLGFIAGPLIGGFTSDPTIVSWFNYATPFFIAAILVLINALLILFSFPETNTTRQGKKVRWLSSFSEILMVLQMKGIRRLFMVSLLFILAFNFYTQFFDVYLISKFSFNQRNIGNIFAYIGIWIVLSQGLLTPLLSKISGPKAVLSFSLLLLSACIFILVLPKDSWWFLFLLPLVSIFHGLSQPNLLSLLSDKSPDHLQGKMLGINQSFQSIAYAVPPIFAGFIIIIDLNLPIISASIIMLFAWLLFITMKDSKK
ncbi:MAG: MFS transporter [Bacteroidetes bacterium]|nr:MFS transporter [Bacteroidota bacterium]